jgi:Holliday junction resolvase/endogenous inhibitor of DNA gyrase (YacG/DUF329 family)
LGVALVCPNCGGKFVRSPSVIRKGRLHFCSKSCRTSYYNKVNNPSKKRSLVTVKCAQCGKEITKERYKFRGAKTFCSYSCVHKYYRHRAKWEKLNITEVKQLLEIYKESKNTHEFGRTIGCKSWGRIRLAFLKHFPDEFQKITEEKKMKANIIYAIGRRFERKVRLYYENIGYFVYQSPFSKSPADLVAIKRGEILLIQVKFNSSYIKSRELDELIALAESINAKPVLVTRKGNDALEINCLANSCIR